MQYLKLNFDDDPTISRLDTPTLSELRMVDT